MMIRASAVIIAELVLSLIFVHPKENYFVLLNSILTLVPPDKMNKFVLPTKESISMGLCVGVFCTHKA